MYHGYHIKNDGELLCGRKLDKKAKDYISFASAQIATLNGCCPICKNEFSKRIQNLGKIII